MSTSPPTPVYAEGLDPMTQAVVGAILGTAPMPVPDPASLRLPSVLLLGAFQGVRQMTRAVARHRVRHDQIDLPIVLLGPLEIEPEMMAAVGCLAANDWVVVPCGTASLQHRVRAAYRMSLEIRQHTELAMRDAVLRTLLPEPFASGVAAGGPMPEPVRHPWVAVLFSDIVDFTTMCAACETGAVVRLLDSLYTAFDACAEFLGAFKVETIGDGYMVAAWTGPDAGADVARLCRMGERMLRVSRREGVAIRVGLHVGPALSGVVGRTRPRYCFFGDTINFASRMQSTGYPGRVQLSCDAVDALSGSGVASEFGPMERIDDKAVKGRGAPVTTFVWDPLSA